MPWNDASKPSEHPGPWDLPEDPAPTSSDDARKARSPAPAPSLPPSPSPWRDDRPKPPRADRRRAGPGAPLRPAAPPPARGPHLDDLGREVRAYLARTARRGPGRRGLARVALAGGLGLFAGWMASGLYVVEPGQSALVTRFGAPVAQDGPGLHYHWPAPIEAVRVLANDATARLDLGSANPDQADARLLTRDGGVFSLAYSVDWRVADPRRHLLALADPRATLRAAARSAMRQAVAETDSAALLSPDHGGAAARAASRMQAELDRAGAGVKVTGVELRGVQPPGELQAGLRDLAAANAEAQLAQRDAAAYRARVLADARADAAKAVQASQGYSDQEVSEAKGEAARFDLVDAQYRKAPQATRDRLYTETMQRVLHDASKVVVQLPKGVTAQINLPPEAIRQKPSPVAPAPAGQGGAR